MENIMSSKLFTTRQGTVLLGVIAAVIAAIALLVYLNHYRNSVNSNATISVLVATHLIQKGTSGDVLAKSTNRYEVAQIPKKQVESGAITDSSTLTGKVALMDINPNSQLTAEQFGSTSGVEQQLAPDQRAVVVDLDSPQAVGGQIGAGSHVDVWVTTSGAANGVTRPVSKLLYQDMYVLNAATGGGNVTLRATSRQAGTIIFASTNDQIWLVLRNTISRNTKPPVIGASSVTGG